MVRNAGKFGKPKRGGGKRFTSARELRAGDAAGEPEGMWKDGDDSEEESDEDEDSDSEESDGLGGSMARPIASTSTSTQQAASNNKFAVTAADLEREERTSKREAKKAAKAKAATKGSDDSSEESGADDLLTAGRANANLTKQMKASSLNDSVKAPTGMNRKEREEQAKKEARERYLAATRAGKTDEAKADLARLAKIRKERAEAAARKQAEQASREAEKEKAIAASGRRK